MRSWLFIAAVNGFLAVGLGAFAAHGLRLRLTAEMLAIFETATRYHFIHALALLAVAWLSGDSAFRGLWAVQATGWAFVAGIVLFSGSLYLYAVTGTRWLAFVTPIGGLAFLAGWATLALAALGARSP